MEFFSEIHIMDKTNKAPRGWRYTQVRHCRAARTLPNDDTFSHHVRIITILFKKKNKQSSAFCSVSRKKLLQLGVFAARRLPDKKLFSSAAYRKHFFWPKKLHTNQTLFVVNQKTVIRQVVLRREHYLCQLIFFYKYVAVRSKFLLQLRKPSADLVGGDKEKRIAAYCEH